MQTEISPIQFFAELYDIIKQVAPLTKRGHRRMPRWRFRIDADTLLEVRPDVNTLNRGERYFDVRIFTAPDIQPEHITLSYAERPKPWVDVKASLRDPGNERPWILQTLSWDTPTRDPITMRISELLRSGKFEFEHLNEAKELFAFNCLICGRVLTAPDSVARLIGPECFDKIGGMPSLTVPWVQVLKQTKQELAA